MTTSQTIPYYLIPDYRKQISTRMKAINSNVSQVSRWAGIHMQTLYNFLSEKSDIKLDTLTIILQTLTDMEEDFKQRMEP